ncbi:hypothetical protein DDM29_000115 [Escherichia coli]|nr:hypothetical protein [Escherichia coli]
MNDFQYELYAQVSALKTALAVTIQVLPDEKKEMALNLLQKFSEHDYTQSLELVPGKVTEVTIEKIDKAIKGIYQDIISQATPDVFDSTPCFLQ